MNASWPCSVRACWKTKNALAKPLRRSNFANPAKTASSATSPPASANPSPASSAGPIGGTPPKNSPDHITDNQALVRLNTDFSLQGLTSQELLAIVSAWQNNAISRDTMFELFRRGEILPDGRTNDEELRLLAHPGRDAAPPGSDPSRSAPPES